ncbi:hypothetical protein Glove_140g60 [Diversispora epigaea]|uniref:TLDc domain-containing protein n=1 Tax=Diversispora epigaea TaxID=1348612 RepID=A0A397IVC3_9GLOM|nr:hypothetical protein Glove_140g60 [Diversispora epigaea]
MCHGHADTIVVAKVSGTDEIVGGYNPLAWDNSKSGYMKTNNSFIFSLKMNIYGPRFGYCEFMMKSAISDFTQDKQCFCGGYFNGYEKPIRTIIGYFSIVDYEVFKIIKKH